MLRSPLIRTTRARFAGGDLAVLLPDAAVKGVLFLLEAAFVGAFLFGAALVAAARAGEREFQRGQQQQRQVGFRSQQIRR